jgi:vesicular inhibitory amino acid transporter
MVGESNGTCKNDSIHGQTHFSPSAPPYADLFRQAHAERASDSAVVLKVTKLDGDTLPNVQWKRPEPDPEASYGAAHNAHGYGIMVTTLFIIGEMVGGGIIAMPNAIARQGWAGIAVLIFVAAMSGFTGVQLGRCWLILQERWPEVYLKHTQKPYPEMGYRAGGTWMRRLVSVCMNLSLFGTATVFLLIVGRNVTQLLESWSPSTHISFCYFVLMVAGILLPATYLGSPKDFWQVSVGAAASTTIAVIIMIVGMSQDYQRSDRSKVRYPMPTFQEFILGYGTIMFAYCGQCAFPTIQHDMRQPTKFPKAIVRSYAAMFFYYLPVSILGYIVYGFDALANEDSILPVLPKGWIQDSVTVLITLHVMFGFIIFVNPINQEMESVFRIPARFTWKRLVVRTVTVIIIVFLAESIPAMNLLLDLIGGTCMAFLTFVFPGSFYLMLRWRTTTSVSKIDTPIRKWEYPINALIILIGVLGAVASIYAFISAVAGGNALFKLPCYISGGN